MYFTFTTQMLFRLLTMLIAPVVLFIPTLYATYKNLDRLPWGLNSWFGCEEDGWNGNGTDPDNPRQYNKPYEWDKHYADEEGRPTGAQGWWPNYKRVNWYKLSFLKRWWLSYQWCALRNVCWNLRLSDFIGESIHYDDITLTRFKWDRKLAAPIDIEWINNNGSRRFFKRVKVFGVEVEYGWEFHPWAFEKTFASYKDLRALGYEHPSISNTAKYKDRSIVSIRVRKL